MKNSIYLIAISILTLVACNDSEENLEYTAPAAATQVATPATPDSLAMNATVSADTSATVATPAATTTNGQVQTQNISVKPTPQQQAPTASKVKDPNPAHGQPGHRCDIPVGASLSTPKQPMPTAAAPQTSIQPKPTSNATNATTPQVQQIAPPKQETAPGFAGKPNPEHGKEGHRCDMPVGATLP